jgi:hypothetical protein
LSGKAQRAEDRAQPVAAVQRLGLGDARDDALGPGLMHHLVAAAEGGKLGASTYEAPVRANSIAASMTES